MQCPQVDQPYYGMLSPAQSTNLTLFQIKLEAEMDKPELEYTQQGRNCDNPLSTLLHGCEILRWL